MRMALMLALTAAAYVEPELALAQTRVNPASVCVNGLRTTHVVRRRGIDYGGVILRCRN